MKKSIFIFSLLVFILLLSACGGDKSKVVKSSDIDNNTETTDTEKVDYDIDGSNYTVASAKINDIISNFDSNKGKIIKIKGSFTVQETPQKNYYACLINDKTACCSQGLEFTLKDKNLKYPDDYPEANAEITVQGKLSSYVEGDTTYYELIDAVIV